jgi:hypothetical protein
MLNIKMPQELILIRASQRNPILWPYNILLIKVYADMHERLDWPKVLKGERIRCNAVKDIYLESKMKFKKLST